MSGRPDQNRSSSRDSQTDSFPVRPAVKVALVILFAIVMWGSQYALRSLWEPDEARYTYVAKEMAQRDSLFIPYRNGELYTHKPPLMFWLIRLSTVFTGGEYNGISGRLPTFLGLLLSLFAVHGMAGLWFDKKTAFHSIIILGTSYLFWHKAGTGQIDMLLLGLEMCALYLLFKNNSRPAPSVFRTIAAYSFMGLAILAKGPVGLVVPLGIYIAFSWVSKNIGRSKRPAHLLWGPFIALLFPLAWLLMAYFSGAPAEYFKEVLWTQNAGRVSGSFGGHYRPVYYYIKYLIVDFMPWTFFMPAALFLFLKDESKTKTEKGLLAWVLFVVVFLSLFTGKRNLYILSVYPAASIFLAYQFNRIKTLSKKWSNATLYSLIAALLILGLACLLAGAHPEMPVAWTVFAPNGILLITGGFYLFFRYAQSGLTTHWLYLFAVFIAVTELLVGSFVFPSFNPVKSPYALAQAASEKLPEDKPLYLYGLDGEIFPLYADRNGKKINDLDELETIVSDSGQGLIVLSQKNRDEVVDAIDFPVDVHLFTMGGKKMAWIEYGFR